jgi:uncharacterized phage-associated protein
MLNPNRTKILEAIVFFSKKLKYPTKMMMYKVLAEIDYRHILETGMPITNLEYFAWKWGPVPKSLDEEISDRENNKIVLPKDFLPALIIDEQTWVNKKTGEDQKGFYYKAKRQPKLEFFSPRQIKILNDVAFCYKDTTPTDASAASHERDKPWYKVYHLKGEKNGYIDFFEFLPKDTTINVDEAKEKLFDIAVFQKNYQH